MCSHICTQSCHHTTTCLEDEPCEEILTITCDCGFRKTAKKCNQMLSADYVEPLLSCDISCASHERDMVLRNALNPSSADTEKETLLSSAKSIGYSQFLIETSHSLYKDQNTRALFDTVQAKVAEFISDKSRRVLNFPVIRNKKLTSYFTELMENVYALKVTLVDPYTKPSLIVRKPNLQSTFDLPKFTPTQIVTNKIIWQDEIPTPTSSLIVPTNLTLKTDDISEINSILIENAVVNMDVEDVKSLINPLFKIPFNVIPFHADSFVITFTPNSSLTDITDGFAYVKNKFTLENSYSNAVYLCFFDASTTECRKVSGIADKRKESEGKTGEEPKKIFRNPFHLLSSDYVEDEIVEVKQVSSSRSTKVKTETPENWDDEEGQ